MKRTVTKIFYSSHFERSFQKLPREIQHLASQREALFRRNCFDQRLRTHKLSGRSPELWSFSIDYRYRIVFRFLTGETVYFIEVGDHSIYQ